MTSAAPTTVNRTLRRLPNTAYRPREYLTEQEVERLIDAARKRGRNGARDAAAILLAFRHGLRAQELCQLRWSQVDLRHGRLHVNRAKGGQESVHPLRGPELRALRPLQGASPYVFVTEAGTPVTTAWFLRMIQRTGKAAKLPFPVHPHMLRHSTGSKLANDGHDTRSLAHYLGHRNLQSTVHSFWPLFNPKPTHDRQPDGFDLDEAITSLLYAPTDHFEVVLKLDGLHLRLILLLDRQKQLLPVVRQLMKLCNRLPFNHTHRINSVRLSTSSSAAASSAANFSLHSGSGNRTLQKRQHLSIFS